ncbi:MAG: Fe-S cluster assembly ATPase SufC [Candidatus Wildermuthbacteria bacterium GWA2_46_15]|uniref:Fe-S cluster assembly ATPase SufC n=1 Tax=Candidatus Wildermuthbacteria bacterium GWA2_46_15 TaxID=1802443 RepID=A0A1G2QMF9_9BACT|nr:MAG: Fe-S cluster assembly ATPase SufC [Candidatus Wildermuthbacteria bacterium GWA2_46_15]
MLKLKNLTVFVKKKKILDNLNFEFKKGQTYVLMGPNGSGKSTLALAVMGHPAYSFSPDSRLSFEGKNLKGLPPEKRAKSGLFLSFQSPLSISGITVFQLLRQALNGRVDILTIRDRVNQAAQSLKIKKELLERSLNEEFSGGEKKKIEVLQAVLLDPKLLIFDEIDTGVDVDSLKVIAKLLKVLVRKKKTLILITHYNRILKYIKPDQVLIMKEGKLVKVGRGNLAKEIEDRGYENL